MNTRIITAALVAMTMVIMALAPSMIDVDELNEISITGYDHGGVEDGSAQIGGVLTWQNNSWNSNWSCTGGLALVTPGDWDSFIYSGADDPHNYTSWGMNLTGADSYSSMDAPEGEWVVTAGLECVDEMGDYRSAGGQYGDDHEDPTTVNLTNGTMVGDVSFTLIEHGEEMPMEWIILNWAEQVGDNLSFEWSAYDLVNGINYSVAYSLHYADNNTDSLGGVPFTATSDNKTVSGEFDMASAGYTDDCYAFSISLVDADDGHYFDYDFAEFSYGDVDCDGGDGTPSPEEFMAMADADGDDNLSLGEIIDAINYHLGEEGEPPLSEEEEGMVEDAFNLTDSDGNALLDLDELEWFLDELDSFDDDWEEGNAGFEVTIYAYVPDFDSATWTCADGGIGLISESSYMMWMSEGGEDPYEFLSWGMDVTSPGTYTASSAPAGDWIFVAALECIDDNGDFRIMGGVDGMDMEDPTVTTLTDNSTVSGIEIYMVEFEDDGGDDLTFVCGDGDEIPFDWVNDGFEDCDDGSDEPQDFDGDGVTDNWFDCADGTNVSMDDVNDGQWDCPDGEDEGYGDDDDDSDLECEDASTTFSFTHIATTSTGELQILVECILSEEESDDMRSMIDYIFGDGDGVVSETEAVAYLAMMDVCYDETGTEVPCEEDEEDEDNGSFTFDGVIIEESENNMFLDGLTETGPISIGNIVLFNFALDDTLYEHVLEYDAGEEEEEDDEDGPEECSIIDFEASGAWVVSAVSFTPTEEWEVMDNGDTTYSVGALDHDGDGECSSAPETASITFSTEPPAPPPPTDTEPVCDLKWTVGSDDGWASGHEIVTGPDGSGEMNLSAGSYMVAVDCSDAEGDEITTHWSTADGLLSSAHVGNGTVFGWVMFTISDCVDGSLAVDYSWTSGEFGGSGVITFNFEGADAESCEEEITGTGGGIPGFTGLLTATALLGAVLYLGRRD